MTKKFRKSCGFTIVEMVIVIAIIAIIAAIVVSSVGVMLYKTKKLQAEITIGRINAELALENSQPTDDEDVKEIAENAGIEDIDEIFSGEFLLGYVESEGIFILLDKNGNPINEKYKGVSFTKIYFNFDDSDDADDDTDDGTDDGTDDSTDDEEDNKNEDEDNNGGSDNNGEEEAGGSDNNGEEENSGTGDGDKEDTENGDEDDGDEDGGDESDDDEDYSAVLKTLKEASEKSESLFVRCNSDGTSNAGGNYVRFGYYPQSEVTDEKSCEYLSKTYCAKSDDGGYSYNKSWKSLDYYISYVDNQKTTDVAWYIDVDVNGDSRSDYRGIYFTVYRSRRADGGTVASASGTEKPQFNNGYKINEVYWFKYEPIVWQIILNDNNTYTLLCKDIIDCGQYCSAEPDDKTFSNSDVSKFLDNTFSGCAFQAAENKMLCGITVEDSSAKSIYIPMYDRLEEKAYVATFGGNSYCTDLTKTPTEYAKCLGASSGYWWLGSFHYDDPTSTYDTYVMYVMDDGSISYCIYSLSEIGYVPAVTLSVSG